MSEKQPIYIFKEGTAQEIFFAPVDADGNAIDPTAAEDLYFAIKTSSLDDTPLVEYQATVDSANLTAFSTTEIGVTFAAADLLLLTPEDYVAEIQMKNSGVWSYSDTFVFRVVPKIGEPS